MASSICATTTRIITPKRKPTSISSHFPSIFPLMKNQLTKDVWVSGLSIILHSSTCLALYQYHTVLIILALYKLEVEKCKTCNFVGGIMEKVWARKREKRILISSLPINSLGLKQVAWSSVSSFLQGSVWIYQQFLPA